MLDIVNGKNEVIGQASREEVHLYGYPHRVTAIFIFNQKRELLVTRRADNNLLDHSAGGHISAGEEPQDSARREAFEEVGLPLSTKLFYNGVFFLNESQIRLSKKEKLHWFSHFIAEVSNSFEPVVHSKEVNKIFWWSLEEVEKKMREKPLAFNVGFIGAMNYFLKKQDSNFQSLIFI